MGAVDEAAEAEILVQAVRVNTFSKLTHADAVRFDQLVGDLFPSTPLSDIGDTRLVECIEQAYNELGLVCMTRQVQKMLEFYQQVCVKSLFFFSFSHWFVCRISLGGPLRTHACVYYRGQLEQWHHALFVCMRLGCRLLPLRD